MLMDFGWCFGWVIQLNHAVIVATVRFGPMRGGNVRRKWPDVPGANAEDVSQGAGQTVQGCYLGNELA